MQNRLLSLFTPSVDLDEAKAQTARIMSAILIGGFILATGNLVMQPILGELKPVIIGINLAVLLVILVSYVLLRRGRVQQAAILFSFFVWAGLTASAFVEGGISSPAAWLPMLTLVVGGLVLGPRAALLFTGLNLAAYGIMYFGQHSGWLPLPEVETDSTRRLVLISISFLMMGLLTYLAQNDIRAFVRDMRHKEHDLTESNRELQAIRDDLEMRVAERTRGLEQRTRYLTVAAEVSRIAASVRDPSELLQQIVDLVAQRLNFYHVGIFLISTDGEYAELKASNSTGGKELVALNHRLKVGAEGIVGFVTRNRAPRVASDVGSEVVHFRNPHLPLTRSEVALPLVAGARLLGALDVQSTEPSAFKAEDVEILQVLANQLAIAIENVRLITETQAALEATRRQAAGQTAQSWSDRLSAGAFGVQRTSLGLQEVKGEANLQEQTAIDGSDTISLPIRVRGRLIGAVQARKHQERGEWTADESLLLQSLTDQLGSALDSARLYEETQQRAEQERLVGEVSTHMRQTLDVDAVIQTAVREIYHALKLQDVSIEMGLPEAGAASGFDGQNPN